MSPLCGSGLTSPGDSSRRGFTFSVNVFGNPRTLGRGAVFVVFAASAASNRWQNESLTTLARLDRRPVACAASHGRGEATAGSGARGEVTGATARVDR